MILLDAVRGRAASGITSATRKSGFSFAAPSDESSRSSRSFSIGSRKDDEERQSLRPLPSGHEPHRGALDDRGMFGHHALELERSHLDSSEVHRVVGAALSPETASWQHLDAVAVPAKDLALRAPRTTLVVDLVVVPVQEPLRHTESRRNQEELSRCALRDRETLLVEDHEIHPQRRSGEGGRTAGVEDRAGEVPASPYHRDIR